MQSVDELAALLKSRKTNDRMIAIARLARRADESEQARNVILGSIRDKSPSVAKVAAEALVDIALPGDGPNILARFDELMANGPELDPGCHVRTFLAYALAKSGYSASTDALRRGIRLRETESIGGRPFDSGGQLRAACAMALAELSDRQALYEISLLLFDQVTELVEGSGTFYDAFGNIRIPFNENVRTTAVKALARLGDQKALSVLGAKLRTPVRPRSMFDEDPNVIAECMSAVVELSIDDDASYAIDLIAPYLESRDQGLVAHAALMLAQTQNPEVIPLIVNALSDLRKDPLRASLLALSTMRTEVAQQALIGLSTHVMGLVRLCLIEVLAARPDEPFTKTLQAMAKNDPSDKVRDAAKLALEA